MCLCVHAEQRLLSSTRHGSLLAMVQALVGLVSEGAWGRLSHVEGACLASGPTHLASSPFRTLPSGALLVPWPPSPTLSNLPPCGLASGPQVNIDHFTKDLTVKNLVEPSLSSFDTAQKKVHALMEKDSLPRFLRSEFYQELVK